MKPEIYPLDANCLCGSGIQAVQCCMPETPPVAVVSSGWLDFAAEAEGSDQLTGRKFDLPESLVLEVTANYPSQQDSEVEAVHREAADLIKSIGDEHGKSSWGEDRLELLGRVTDALYALRYHEQQFISRLRLVVTKQVQETEARTGRNVQIRFNDRPLKFELEAFLIRQREVLEAVGKFGEAALGQSPDGFGTFCKLLKSNVPMSPLTRRDLTEAIEENWDWIEKARNLRNDIVHDAKFEVFAGAGHGQGSELRAEVEGVDAGQFCIRGWTQTRDLVAKILRRTLDSVKDNPERHGL